MLGIIGLFGRLYDQSKGGRCHDPHRRRLK
jgi:hypothetical protein